MYPTFCSYRYAFVGDETAFASLDDASVPGTARPGLALAAQDDRVEVLVAPNGRTVSMPRAAIRPGLSEAAALAMMDEVEEAIEDARDEAPSDTHQIERLERTLDLLERALDA